MNWKILDHWSDGKRSKALRRLISAHRAYGALVGVCHYLDDLEKQWDGSTQFLMPVVDYSLVVYCSIFNSGNPSADGICKHDIGEIFPDGPHRGYHELLTSYRDKEIAHLTDFSKRTLVLTTEKNRKVSIRGDHSRDHFCNSCQPRRPEWDQFLEHLKGTRDWFKVQADGLTAEIEEYLRTRPAEYFSRLADAPDLPPEVEKFVQKLEHILQGSSVETLDIDAVRKLFQKITQELGEQSD